MIFGRDLLLSYTDGVNEAKNENGDQFTEERILKTALSDWKNSEDLLDRLLDEIFTFRGDAAQSDDITMLILHNLFVN